VIDLTIKVQDDRALQMKLRKLADADKVISETLGEWASETLDSELYGMGNYAPPPPNSTYIRTGRLGANWGLRRVGRTAVEFFNLTSYARYVVGNAAGGGQAAIHVGRWWLGRRKIEQRIERLADMLKTAFDKAAR
jgi:hypothetical protein